MRVPHLAVGVLLLTGVLLAQHSEPGGSVVQPSPADKTKPSDTPSPPSQVAPQPKPIVEVFVEPGRDIAAKAAQEDGEKYALTVRKLVREQSFDELDRMADEARRGKTRFVGGGWKLHQIYTSLTTVPRKGRQLTDSDWQDHLERLQRWISLKPDSITARVTLASVYEDYAWFARGPGLADTVTPEGWKLFEERMTLAREILEDASRLKEKCPHWFYVMQEVQFALDEGDPLSLLKEAMAFEPAYYYYYSTYVHYLLPKWYGKEGDAAKFAATVADKTGGSDGDFVYFQIAAALNHSALDDQPALKQMDWARIMRGFRAMEKQYGTADLRLNQIARLAVSFSDPVIAHEMFTRVGDHWSPIVWEKRDDFDNSKDWANRGWLQSLSYVIDANMQTMEGLHYQERIMTEFSGKFQAAAVQCAVAGNEMSRFYLFLQIGDSGKVQLLYAEPGTKVSGCLGPQVTAATFPPPPTPSYWVKIMVDTMGKPPSAKSMPAMR